MARVAYGMAIASERVKAEIIDWDDFRELSRTHRVSMIPKTFVNYGDPFTGVLPEASILERVREAQPLP